MPTTRQPEWERRIAEHEAHATHHVSCPGPDLRVSQSVIAEQVSGLKRWEEQQNGTLRELRDEVRLSRQERQAQLDSLRKDVSDKHDALLDTISQRERSALALTLTAMGVLAGGITILLKVLGV